MSTYEILLDEFISVLNGTPDRPGFQGTVVKVEKSAEDLVEFEKLNPSIKCRIVADFRQDRLGTDENDTSMLVGEADMDRIMYFQFSVECRKKFGEYRALHVSEMVQRMLLGYKSEDLGGEMYAFANVHEEYRDNIWYYRVIMRYKHVPLSSLKSFRVNGDEDTGYLVTEVTFEPVQINVLDGQTTGYLQYLIDDEGNKVTVPEGYVLIKNY